MVVVKTSAGLFAIPSSEDNKSLGIISELLNTAFVLYLFVSVLEGVCVGGLLFFSGSIESVL